MVEGPSGRVREVSGRVVGYLVGSERYRVGSEAYLIGSEEFLVGLERYIARSDGY